MTIRKGEPWGEPGPVAEGAPRVRTDAELRAAIEPRRRAGEELPEVGLLGGDLCRTLGGRGDAARLTSPDAMRFPVDLGSVLLDGRQHWFTAHLVVRRSWWVGRVVAVMNAQWVGAWDVAPRSHPNDGLLDVLDGDPPLGERLKARPRLRTGTHVPHPAIAERRVAAYDLELARPAEVWLDGERVGRARSVVVRVEPDAFHVVV